MIEGTRFILFMSTATLLAVSPGPGMLYVLSRTLHGGRREGFLSAGGTFVGGLVHAVAAGLGLSAILTRSALAFEVVRSFVIHSLTEDYKRIRNAGWKDSFTGAIEWYGVVAVDIAIIDGKTVGNVRPVLQSDGSGFYLSPTALQDTSLGVDDQNVISTL